MGYTIYTSNTRVHNERKIMFKLKPKQYTISGKPAERRKKKVKNKQIAGKKEKIGFVFPTLFLSVYCML